MFVSLLQGNLPIFLDFYVQPPHPKVARHKKNGFTTLQTARMWFPTTHVFLRFTSPQRPQRIFVQALGSSQLEELVLTDNLLGPKVRKLFTKTGRVPPHKMGITKTRATADIARWNGWIYEDSSDGWGFNHPKKNRGVLQFYEQNMAHSASKMYGDWCHMNLATYLEHARYLRLAMVWLSLGLVQ